VEAIMAWCEGQPEVCYCLGLAKNWVLIKELGPTLAEARARHCLSGSSTRAFIQFSYQTRTSWSRSRRVIGKAEVMTGGDNPRLVVTNLPKEGFAGEPDRERFLPARLYEELYCARGEMENMLKQQVLDLKADRMSTHWPVSNQLNRPHAANVEAPHEISRLGAPTAATSSTCSVVRLTQNTSRDATEKCIRRCHFGRGAGVARSGSLHALLFIGVVIVLS
jgi:hypothetical protein